MGTITLYHGSYEQLSEIKRYNTTAAIDFGGIFASGSAQSAESHGDFLHKICIEESKILTQDIIDYQLDADKKIDVLKSVLPACYIDDFAFFYRAAIDDIADSIEIRHRAKHYGTDPGEFDWWIQSLRGDFAKKLGYHAVEMDDEHGTSYLVFADAKIELVL